MSENKLKPVESRSLRRTNENNNKMVNAVVDNFGSIVNLASDILEAQKMKIQSDAILNKMKEDRKSLIAESEAYAKRKNADTNSVVERMRVIQDMMKDFYQYNNSNMSGEEFSKVISDIITQMGRLD